MKRWTWLGILLLIVLIWDMRFLFIGRLLVWGLFLGALGYFIFSELGGLLSKLGLSFSSPEQEESKKPDVQEQKQEEQLTATPAKKRSTAVSQSSTPPSTPSPFTRLLELAKDNFVSFLLLLGSILILFAAIHFLRSEWQSYKYLVFYIFTGFTAFCFVVGYYLSNKDKAGKISFIFLLLASFFFPLIFYFGVKIGLIPDRGNQYIVLWLTSIVFVFHGYLLRNHVFAWLGSLLIFMSNWSTLQKFVSAHPEYYSLSFAIHALVFTLVVLGIRQGNRKLAKTLLPLGDLAYLFSLVLAIYYWDTPISSWVMVIGTVDYFVLLAAIQKENKLREFFATGLLLLGCAGFAHYGGWSKYQIGTSNLLIGLLVWGLTRVLLPRPSFIGKGLARACFLQPVVIFSLYCVWGSYSSQASPTLFLLCSNAIAGASYLILAHTLKRSMGVYFGVFFASLLLLDCYRLLELEMYASSLAFALWSLVLFALSQVSKAHAWLKTPLFVSSQLVSLGVLLALGAYGLSYYQDHFYLLQVTLLVVCCFYFAASIYLQKLEMFSLAVLLHVVWGALYAYHFNLFWQEALTLVITLAIFVAILLEIPRSWQSSQWRDWQKIVFLPVVLAFLGLSFYPGLEAESLHHYTNMSLLAVFFFLQYFFSRQSFYFGWVLVTLTAMATLYSYHHIAWQSWSQYWLIGSLVVIGLTKGLARLNSQLHPQRILQGFSYLIALFAVGHFIYFFRVYYVSDFQQGQIVSALLVILVLALFWQSKNTLFAYGLLLTLGVHFLFWLPDNLAPFSYAIAYFPYAIVLVVIASKRAFWQSITVNFGHCVVAGFLLLPAVLPGMVPPATIAIWPLLLAFGFYFLLLFQKRVALYSYCTAILFLVSVLVACNALKMWGNQIALVMAISSLLVWLGGKFLLTRQQNLSQPYFLIALLAGSLIVIAELFQGQMEYATLTSLVLCSLLFGLLAYTSYDFFLPTRLLALTSVVLFSLSYYLFLGKILVDFPPTYFSQHLVLGSCYLLWPMLAVALARILPYYYHPSILLVILVTPLFSISQAHTAQELTCFVAISAVVYFFAAKRFASPQAALLSLVAFTSALLLQEKALISWYSLGWEVYMLTAILLSGLFFHVKERLPQSSLWSGSLQAVSWLTQLVFLTMLLFHPQTNIYVIAGALGVYAVSLLLLKKHNWLYGALAGGYFLLSYYLVVFSWSIHVWELHTVPIALFLFGLSAYYHKRDFALSQDALLAGALLLMASSLIQSYHGWYAHLSPVGVSPYTHLYHSLFLSAQSVLCLVYGVYRRQLVLFLCGGLFLISDLALVSFAYVQWGNIPYSIWWATLGITIVISALVLEYRREKVLAIVQKFKNWQG